MPYAAPRWPLLLRSALTTALATSSVAGCAHGTTGGTTLGAHAPAEDPGEALPHEAELTWFVRPLPTTGTVRLVLFLDAGSRDATPPQVATLAAFALAERLSTGAQAGIHPNVTPDATSFELTCPSAEVGACVRRFEALLRPTPITTSELTNAHRRLRDDRARAAGDATRAAQAAALRALFGTEAPRLFPLGEERHDGEATPEQVAAYVAAHYGSQRALLVAEGDVAADALEQPGAALRRLPHARAERARRELGGASGVAVEVGHAGAAAVALRARDAEHARATLSLLRDAAFVGEAVTGGVDVAAFSLRGGSVVLLTVPSARLEDAPGAVAMRLATLALRASDAADGAPWRTAASGAGSPTEPPARPWPGAGGVAALGERWAAQQPGGGAASTEAFERDRMGLGISVDGGRADALEADDPDAETRRAAETALGRALAEAQRRARPWRAESALAAQFALPDEAEGGASARLFAPLSAALPNGSRVRVGLSPTAESGVLVAFEGGAGEDGEPLHGRSALAITALAERCARMLGALDGVVVSTRIDADRVGLWFEDTGGGWARTADVAARCALEHSPDDTDLQHAKVALRAQLGPEGSDARMRAWVAAALNPAEPGRVAPLGSGERLDAIRMGDVSRALERLRVGARTHVVALVRGSSVRAARRLASRVAALVPGEAFAPTRSRALGDSPHAVAWLGATPNHARLLVALRDPVAAEAGEDAPAARLGQAYAAALAAQLRSTGLDVVWVGGGGGAYGHWSALAIETTLDALDALPARVEAALRDELPLQPLLVELTRTAEASLAEQALALLPQPPSAPRNPSSGARYIVARPQGAEAVRRRGG